MEKPKTVGGAMIPCGCHWDQKDGVVHCPLHDAAQELLEACKAASKWMTPVLEGFGVQDLPPSHPVHQVNAAIARAMAPAIQPPVSSRHKPDPHCKLCGGTGYVAVAMIEGPSTYCRCWAYR